MGARARIVLAIGIVAAIAGTLFFLTRSRVRKSEVAFALTSEIQKNQFPTVLHLQSQDKPVEVDVHYTLDPVLQKQVRQQFELHRPDYGAFVAMEANTGRILAMVSYSREGKDLGNLALRATFPAASVFKIVTAAAALDTRQVTADTVIAFNGADHTLYRRNVNNDHENRWTRRMTLREAFARSVNTVFAKLGMHILDPMRLKERAERFQFNRDIPADFSIQRGQLNLNETDKWALAEVASGFNRVALMSPVQGALIASAVVNDGIMMEPYLVDHLETGQGVLYEGKERILSIAMTPSSAVELRHMMHETVKRGTSRSAFRSFFPRSSRAIVSVGGKTGSLKGREPAGKCDWFVGYLQTNSQKIGIAALTVNEDLWRVKSSYLARLFMDSYLKKERTRLR